ncbi:hypothetical protein Y032_0080g1390 [Ancylostoma ceylanicum]|nr:hypothetical protein Y032_0080g1390 [Ancylostoma ceylanicum]
MLFVHSEGAVAEILVGINLCGSLHSPRFILSDSWKRTAITKVRAHVRKLSVPYCAAFIVTSSLIVSGSMVPFSPASCDGQINGVPLRLLRSDFKLKASKYWAFRSTHGRIGRACTSVSHVICHSIT